MEIQVAHVRSQIGRTAETDLGIHIGAVQVDLPPMRMHDLAHSANVFFKHSMRRGIGNHHGGQAASMLGRLRLKISKIHIAPLIAGHRNHRHPAH